MPSTLFPPIQSRNLAILLLLALSGLLCSDAAQAEQPQTGTARSLFAADYQKKVAALIRPDNSIVWQIPIRDIHDAQPLENGHWLLQTSFTNVIEVDGTGKEIWRYDAGKTADGKQVEIHAFRRISESVTMIAES